MIYKVFKTNHIKYLYDRQMNRIVKIGEDDYACFLDIEKCIDNDLSNEVLERYQKHGFCKENELQTIEHTNSSDLCFYLEEHLEDLILQVTQDCNLRCNYCAYSGKYHNRSHAKRSMSFETACKAIDFYIRHSKRREKHIIGFYGGEPLLEIKLIKKVISYIEENYEEINATYIVTTNGTLLTDDVIDYFAEKNVSLMISIDGPKNIQNENRCFANGLGSFDIVIKNISKIKDKYPDYYYKKCSTNTVLAPNQDFGCVQEFLMDDDLMKDLTTRLSLISDTGTNEVFQYKEVLMIEQSMEILKQMLIMIGEIDSTEGSRLFGDFEMEIYKQHIILSSGSYHYEKGHPGGPCIAGAKKTFVDVNGDIYPCEKLPELLEMKLGNIETGFQYDKVDSMINIARITEEQCKNCWAFIFCYSCVAYSVDDKGISKEKRLKKCVGIKNKTFNSLKDMMRLEEYGFNFDILN